MRNAKFITLRSGAIALLAVLLLPCTQAAEGDDTAITIYSSAQPGAISPDLYRPIPGSGLPNAMAVPGYAMVRHDRRVTLANGRSILRFTDVAALIDPTTVTFTSLTEPRARVVEQSFQFDLVSTEKLLLKYIDRPITVEHAIGDDARTVSGTLLSSVDGLLLKDKDGSIHALRNYSAVRFPDLPGGLDTRPTLVWDVLSPRGGEHRARVAYQTGGITWWADYNLTFTEGKDENSGLLDLAAWVSIINQSGAAYPEARLKLIAGDVNRVQPQVPMVLQRRAMEAAATADSAAGFDQKAFFEFHLYTLGRRTSLPNNSTRQIELLEAAKRIPTRRILLYDALAFPISAYGAPITDRGFGGQTDKKVDVILEFRNEKQYGLGVPLPAGRMRVSKLDEADGSLEFIGEDSIDHTPRDEPVRVRLGAAFDVVGERRQVDFAIDTRARWMEEEIEVKVRNHKETQATVVVREHMHRWSNWRMVSQSQQFQKDDARTITFNVNVPKDGEAVVRYRVRYSW